MTVRSQRPCSDSTAVQSMGDRVTFNSMLDLIETATASARLYIKRVTDQVISLQISEKDSERLPWLGSLLGFNDSSSLIDRDPYNFKY